MNISGLSVPEWQPCNLVGVKIETLELDKVAEVLWQVNDLVLAEVQVSELHK